MVHIQIIMMMLMPKIKNDDNDNVDGDEPLSTPVAPVACFRRLENTLLGAMDKHSVVKNLSRAQYTEEANTLLNVATTMCVSHF